jgi:hypothetical protein
MKEADWEDCIEQNSAIKRKVDKGKANSLIETAKARINFLENNVLDENSCNFIFEGYYSSVTELLHSLVLLNGYKIHNHICLGYFIRDVLKNRILYEKFDDCRYKRNSLLYYGKQMRFEVAKESINLCIELVDEITNLINYPPK